jgi:signal transduction histidine kinase
VISIQDITENCKIEEEMMKRQRFESIGVLASGIAHDFNNILTAISGNISLAKIDLNPKDILERLIETEKALNKAKYLTQQLLNFSKSGLPAKESTEKAIVTKEETSEKADIEQFLAYLDENGQEITEEEKAWYVLCIKNGVLCR